MSYFNTIKSNQSKPSVVNHEKGKSFSLTPELELATLLTTSTEIKSNYYESKDERIERLKNLLETNKDKKGFIEFAGKATIYSRKVVGLKTISHISTALLTQYTPNQSWAKPFYSQVINYIPDLSETIGAYKHFFREGDKIGALPKAMKVSFAEYLAKTNYHLASKWQMSNKTISLIDLVNLLHIKNETWVDELMKTGSLKPAETKEVLLSKEVAKAKLEGKTESEINEIKNKVYADLNAENKMGYYAMITGLVQVSSGTDEQIDLICRNIENKEAIKKSLIHPLQLTLAYNQVMMKGDYKGAMKLMIALSNAIELCYDIPEIVENATKDSGKTCIMLDISGSMSGKFSKIASLVSAVLLKFGNTDIIRYDTEVDEPRINPRDTVFSIASQIDMARGGTQIHKAFEYIKNRYYDKIVILTDQQDFGSDSDQGNIEFKNWTKLNNPNANVYSVDVSGYGNSVFNNNSPKVHTYTAFDKTVVGHLINAKPIDLVAVINEVIKFD